MSAGIRAEGQDQEFKRSVKNFTDIGQTACAFANSIGGDILVGVDDSGKALGVDRKVLDDMQLRLTGALKCVSPVPRHEIVIEEMDGKAVVRVKVHPSPSDSFCTHQGMVYVRSGSANLRMEGASLLQFMCEKQVFRFDSRSSDLSVGDLDLRKLEDYVHRRSPGMSFEMQKAEEVLGNLGLMVGRGERSLRNAAVLMFGQHPHRAIPQNEVRLVRFAGREPIKVLDSLFANGTILENLEEAESFILKNIRVGFHIEGMYRKEVPEYPFKAIRELLLNAVVHRDYFDCNGIQINIFEDRMEFINPGRLAPGFTLSDLGTISVQRNPLIYSLLRELHLVEGLATGIPLVRSSMIEQGLPEPFFEEKGNFFKVTLFNAQVRDRGSLSARQRKALGVLEQNGQITTGEVSFLLGVSAPTAYNDLQDLKEKGYIRRQGKGRGSVYRLEP